MRATIRHDRPAASIVAYLDGAPPTHAGRLIAYLYLMHRTPPKTARGTIFRLLEAGRITRVQRGVYRRA